MEKFEIYNKIKRNSLPLLEAFEIDLLKHDYNDILKSEKCSFLHFTRNYGTHIVKLSTENYPEKNEIVPYLFGKADRNHILKQKSTIVETLKTSCLIVQYYNVDTDTVKLISMDEARSIVQSFTLETLKKWSRKDDN